MSDTIKPAATPAGTRCESLETRYERLRYAYGNLIESYEELTEQLHELRDIHVGYRRYRRCIASQRCRIPSIACTAPDWHQIE